MRLTQLLAVLNAHRIEEIKDKLSHIEVDYATIKARRTLKGRKKSN